MINIVNSKTGEAFDYNEKTGRIFKDGVLLTNSSVEPIYSGNDGNNIPNFIGLYLKNKNTILTVSGNEKEVSDINQIK